MKIVILTQPLRTNYGGILQCYALQTVLERMGHDVMVLTKPRYGRFYFVRYPLVVCKRLLKRILGNNRIAVFKAPHEIAEQNTSQFIYKYIKTFCKRKWTIEIAYHFDVIVVGSDQVWRPAYSKPIEEAFLSFLENVKIKRVAYAASFGVNNCDEYSDEQLKKCSCLLKKFDAVSVRESSGILLCKKYFGVDAVQMLDPTLLLNIYDYRKLIKNGKVRHLEGNMLVYMLDNSPEKNEWVNLVAKEMGLIPFWLDSPNEQKDNVLLESCIKISVEQWLYSFENADFVLTDSFHGCVFSLIFKKKFIVFGNEDRGVSRLESLLSLFSLKDRLIHSKSEYIERKIDLHKSIDYDLISKKIEKEYNKSIEFLENVLN